MVILYIPKYYSKDVQGTSAFKWAGAQIRALAGVGHQVYVVVPCHKDGWLYNFETITRGMDGIIPLEMPMVIETRLGVGAWPTELLKLLTPTSAPVPYDMVFNMNTPMTVPMYRCLLDSGFTRLTAPVATVVSIAASYTEFNRLPAGIKEWYAMWEYLETGASLFGPVLVSNPYDFRLMQTAAKSMFSASKAREALWNIQYKPSPVDVLLPPYQHTHSPKKPFRICAMGGFGLSREEMGDQNKAIVEAMRILKEIPELPPIQLVVCTQTQKLPWHDEIQKMLGEKIEINFNLSREKYVQTVKGCQAAINLRQYDGLNASFIEQMIMGKPVIWWHNKYTAPWADVGSMPIYIEKLSADDIAQAILRMMRDYKKVSIEAFKLGELKRRQHSAVEWAMGVTNDIITPRVRQAQTQFNRGDFSSMKSAFRKLPKEGFFEEYYQIVKKQTTSGSLSRYSRHWVLCMLRKMGYETYSTDGSLRMRKI